jgi:SAM-dependent methyltransferase
MYEYNSQFLDYTHSFAMKSARAIVPIIQGALHPTSVVDFGCGRGAWLQVWKTHGALEVVGVDGNYVNLAHLAIDESEFRACDLGATIDLTRRFDLVESLEVAEHLPSSRARAFVADLCRHGDIVLFAAAPPGQGGEYHINEQPYEYWRSLFDGLGYEPFDFIRPRIASRKDAAPWYRYNTLLYVKRAAVDSLPDAVRQTRVPKGTAIRDVSPLLYKLRKQIVRRLPTWATQELANVAKHIPR